MGAVLTWGRFDCNSADGAMKNNRGNTMAKKNKTEQNSFEVYYKTD